MTNVTLLMVSNDSFYMLADQIGLLCCQVIKSCLVNIGDDPFLVGDNNTFTRALKNEVLFMLDLANFFVEFGMMMSSCCLIRVGS